MNKFEILSTALEYIEENLVEGVTPEMCAEACSYSLSSMQKMFKCTFRIGIGDYISRRRLTTAAKELLETDMTVLDIALKYGYNSHEVFTRAFVRLWGVTPSEFRKNRTFSEIFPKFDRAEKIFDEKGNEIMYSEKKFDVSHLYDFIRERKGKYAVCLDTVQLMYINETYGSAAGDMAIAECLRRIDIESDNTMLPIRIGGDEFVLITDYENEAEAKAITEKILSHNGETITFRNNEIPVSLRGGILRIPEDTLRYNELFGSFMNATPH